MDDRKTPQLYCHVCGGLLHRGGQGYSNYEYSCQICLAAYHVEAGMATYLTPSFVVHGESPVALPVAQLLEPNSVQHTPTR